MTLGRHQITVHRTLAEFNHWSIKYRHWMIAVAETAEHDLWICIDDLRGFIPVIPDKAELRATYPRSMFYVEDGRRLFISESSLRRLIQRVAKVARHTEALKFLDWFERNTGQVAARKRAEKGRLGADRTNDTLEPVEGDGVAATSRAKPEWDMPTRPADWAADAVKQPPKPDGQEYRAETAHRSMWSIWISPPLAFIWDFFGQFLRGERGIVQTFFVASAVGYLPMKLWMALLPDEANWAEIYKVVMAWNVGILVLAMACTAWFMVSMTRSMRRIWDSPAGAKWSAVFYLGSIPIAFSIGLQEWSLGLLWETGDYMAGRRNPAKVYADPYLGRVVVSGDLGFGSSQELARVLAENPKYKLVEIEGPGGYALEGFRMAKLISDRELDTVTLDHCESACTLLFVSGAQRYLGPDVEVGFHRSGTSFGPVSTTWTETDYQVARLLHARGVDEKFIFKSLTPSIRSMWFAPHPEMYAAGYATHQWSERKPGY